MNTPPLLMLAALVFWGWRTGLTIPGVIAGLLLEGSRFAPLRWDFSAKDLIRIRDLCILLILGAALYAYFSNDLSNSGFTVVQWLPLLVLPLMLAQAFGHLDRIPVSTFFLLLFKRPRAHPGSEAASINVSYPYFGVCLVAASTTNQRTPWFFFGLCALLACSLWPQRSRRFSATTWLGLLFGVLCLAHFSADGLSQLQMLFEARISEWISGWGRTDINPGENRTAIGQIGRLKLSGRIIRRVEAEGAAPELLRLASYDRFTNITWSSTQKEFVGLNLESEEGYWKLITGKAPRQVVTIAGYLPKGNGVIALPLGTAEIDKLPVSQLKTNGLGVVEAAEGPGLVRYVARYGPGASLDGATNPTDTAIPPQERDAVARIAQELDLDGKPAAQVARRLTTYFLEKYVYTTFLVGQHRDPTSKLSPLSHFLLEKHAGHCEYFASATVLLLRQVRIPARYAVGYSVQESAGNHKFIVRERHTHAWAVYYDREARVWRDLDTTPTTWGPIEAANASSWEPISDFFSRIWFEFSKWRWLADRETLQRYLIWLLVPLAGILTWRLVTAKRRAHKVGDAGHATAARQWPGFDSEFYLVEGRLAALGLGREPGEPLANWIARLRANPGCPASPDSLSTMLDLHYRYRFDPAGLASADRTRLRDDARRWLDEARSAKSS